MCLYVCVHICVFRVHVCARVCERQRSTLTVIPQVPSVLFLETWRSSSRLGWLSSRPPHCWGEMLSQSLKAKCLN